MDELDSAILGQLQHDARQTNRELARRLGVAPSTTLERVRSLERRNVIRGYHADVSLAALNRGVQALISVQVRPLHRQAIDSFQDFAVSLPEVLSLFVVAGSDDFLLHVAVPDLDRLHGFLIDRLSKRKEVAGFKTSVITATPAPRPSPRSRAVSPRNALRRPPAAAVSPRNAVRGPPAAAVSPLNALRGWSYRRGHRRSEG